MALINLVPKGQSGTNGTIGFARSTDGLAWTMTSASAIPQSKPSWHSYLHRATFIPLNSKKLDVWYSGWRRGAGNQPYWDVFRTTLTEATEGTRPDVTEADLYYTSSNMPKKPKDNKTTVDLPDSYPSLRLAGTGVMQTPQTLRLATGVADLDAESEVGITVSSPTISTLAEAYSAGTAAAMEYAAPSRKLSGTALALNERGFTGSMRYPLFSDGEIEYDGLSFGDFNAVEGAETFEGFAEDWYDRVRSDFENQMFGNVEGARVRFREAYYRIRSATYSDDSIKFDAEADTVYEDLTSEWDETSTFGDFNATWAGSDFGDMAVKPLWRK